MSFDHEQVVDKVVNVASVPHRSLFRYPGGKTWLVPRARTWLRSRPSRPSVLIEPFTGGGIIGLTAAFEALAEHVVFVELDPIVAAVWQVLAVGDGPELADRILAFTPTTESVTELLQTPSDSTIAEAFKTVVKNRTLYGGILAAGSAPLKRGEGGKGLASRWYPETLRRRIHDIHAIRDRFTFVEGDGLTVMEEYGTDERAVFFIDPPYTAGGAGKNAGRRLYNASALDHVRLFDLCGQVAGDFLMTYDNVPEVLNLAERSGFDYCPVSMQSRTSAILKELLIGRDLGWIAQSVPRVGAAKAA